MPYVDSRGRVAHGVAGSGAFVDNTRIDNGGDCGWFDADRVVYQHGGIDGWYVMLYDVAARTYQRGISDPAHHFYGQGANVLYGGGGVWAGWADTPGVGLFASTGLHLPAAGLLGVGADGEIAYVASYQAGGPARVRERDGSEWLLTDGPVFELRLLGKRRAIWRDGTRTIRVAGLPQPRQLGEAWSPRAAFAGGRWWVSYYAAGHGVVLHPFDAFDGYAVVPVGDAWQDVAALDGQATAIAVAWSTTRGEGAADVRRIVIDVEREPRVNLAAAGVAPVPINRPTWLAFFTGRPGAVGGWDTNDDPPQLRDPHALPGNGYLDVPSGTLFDMRDRAVALFVTAGSVSEIETACRTAPIAAIAYWDARTWPALPALRPIDWLAVQAYCGASESPAAFEYDLRRIVAGIVAVRPLQPIALVPQCYTTNPGLTTDLAAVAAVASRVAAAFPNVIAVLPFSGNGRAGGLHANTKALPAWQQIAAGIPAAPEILMPNVTAPRFTITADRAFPVTATAPLALRCYVVNEGGGEPEWIDWMVASSPGGPWTIVAHNQGWDKDHTYRWTAPGTYYVRARAYNYMGSHATGLTRQVVVLAADVSDPPDPPDPSQPPTGERVRLATAHGRYLAVGDDMFLTQRQQPQTFILHDLGNGLWALAAGGRYGAVENDLRVKVDRALPLEWERFVAARNGDMLTLRTTRALAGAGYLSAHEDGTVRADAPHQLSWETFRVEPATGATDPASVSLTVDGRIFRRAGEAWRWRGVSAFRLLDRFARGEDIAPFLQAYAGYNLLRVWPYVTWPGTGWEVASHDATRAFLQVCEQAGFYVELTLLTDDDAGRHGWARDLVRFLAEARPPNLVLEIGNEPTTHKSIDTEALRAACDTSGFLYSSGNYEESELHFGHFLTAHTPRDEEWPRKAHDLMEYYGGGGPGKPTDPAHRKPCVADEPIRPDQARGDRDGDFLAYFATASLLGAGATFHCETGKHAQLPTADEARLAALALQGLTVFPADAPNGGYERPVEDSLRTYRVGPCMVRVRPTTPASPLPGFTARDDRGITWTQGG